MISGDKIQTYIYDFRRNMLESLQGILSLVFIRIFLVVSWGANIVNWILAYYIISGLSGDQVILHYNVDFGIDFIGSPSNIYLIPLSGACIIGFNFFLVALFNKYRDIKILASLLMSAAVLANLVLSFGLIAVYVINFT